MKTFAILASAAIAQTFNDKPEQITNDGQCQSVKIEAKVNNMWETEKMMVDFKVSDWSVMRALGEDRKARLINDWSRLKFGLKYFNKKLGEYVDISPRINQNERFVEIMDQRGNNVWRMLFKDKKSKELSSMGVDEGELSITTWIDIVGDLDRENLENDVLLEVSNPQLCDGGYEAHLVHELIPANPDPQRCDAVNKTFLEENYQRPPNGGTMAQLFTHAEPNEVIGCIAYTIFGFDAPRTAIDLSQHPVVKSFQALNANLKPCPKCAESSFWKVEFLPERVATQINAKLHIDMLYFGTEEQAPIAYFQYNCDFNDRSCVSGGQSGGQNGGDQGGNQPEPENPGDQQTQPGQPDQPPQPTQPATEPDQGTQPGQPGQPTQPGQPPQPTQPGQPGQETQPDQETPSKPQPTPSQTEPWNPGEIPITGITPNVLNKYGCVCAGMGETPMGRPMGKPVDAIDRACFMWRKCNNCVGAQCGGYKVNQYKQCTNKAGSCKRQTCECDMELARTIEQNLPYNPDNIIATCSPGSGSGDPGCCLKDELFTFYNKFHSSCCPNGDLVPANQC